MADSTIAAFTAVTGLDGDEILPLTDDPAGANVPRKSTVADFFGYTPWKRQVRVATTAALAANTRTANVLDANANGALGNLDGVAVAVGDRVLVKNEATGANNGIYTVTSLGAVGSKWKLTRAADMDDSKDCTQGVIVPVDQGTEHADTIWQATTNQAIVLNTTALTFGLVLTVSAKGTAFQRFRMNSGGTGFEFGGAVAAKISWTGTQSINSATLTTLTLTGATEDYDTNTLHDTVSNQGRFTLPAGKWLLIARVGYAANAAATRAIAFLLNGTTGIGDYVELMAVTTASTKTTLQQVAVVDLAANDFVEIQGYQTSGGALNVTNVNFTAVLLT